MFTIDSNAKVTVYKAGAVADPEDSGAYVHSQSELAAVIQAHPGEWSVLLWNQLPGTLAIHVPPGERTAKFRNRATAAERIWQKLCELYPDAVNSEDMPKVKERHATKPPKAHKVLVPRSKTKKQNTRSDSSNGAGRIYGRTEGRKSAWAEELTTELRKRYNPGQDFSLEDVYKLIPGFQRRHKENHHIAARLRTTLAQDLRGSGVVKSLKRGQYRMA